MKFAVVRAPDFPLQSLRRVDSNLNDVPVAIVEGEGKKAALTYVSGNASGVQAGLPTPLAIARCPQLQIRTRSVEAEIESQALLVASVFALAPRVEDTAPGVCTIDLRGADAASTLTHASALISTLAVKGLKVCIGFGETPWVANLASEAAGPVLVVENTPKFLAPLPLAMAEPTAKQAQLLARWGISTLGGLSGLPKGEIGKRLGPEGVHLWERAAGQFERVLTLTDLPVIFKAHWDYEVPIESLEPLAFILKRFSDRLSAELEAAHFVASDLLLELSLEDESTYGRKFRLPESSRNPDVWLRVLDTHLQGVRRAERVVGVSLTAIPTRPETRQDGLFDTGLSDPPAFFENLARVAAIVGADSVGTPEILDTHRPDAVKVVTPPSVIPPPEEDPVHGPRGARLRRFRPMRPIEVLTEGTHPHSLNGAVRGSVVEWQGPWRSSGEWWLPTQWSLERWQVQLSDGGLYQIIRTTDGWALEGALS